MDLAEQDRVDQLSELFGGELLQVRLEGLLYVCLMTAAAAAQYTI